MSLSSNSRDLILSQLQKITKMKTLRNLITFTAFKQPSVSIPVGEVSLDAHILEKR